MQELVGRLTSLDPEASETLKVITYFDHLVEGRVGVETMVRGAALLSGAVAGLRRGGRTIRIDPSGVRLPDAGSPGEPGGLATSDDSPGWPQRECGDGVVVWLERIAAAHANDAMVLERLAHSVMVSGAGTAGDAVARQSLEVLLDAGSAPADRDRAAGRLGLEPRTLLTVVATGGTSIPTTPRAALASARMATAYGLVTASLVRGEACAEDVAGDEAEDGAEDGAGEPAAGSAPTTRVGVGSTVTVDHLPRSWAEALLALRVTTGREPWVRVGDLGLLAQAVEAADHASSPPADVAGVERAVAHGWSVEALESLADAESVRAVARAAGLHHSTLQARLADLPTHLGFDATTGRGRARLLTALIVRRAASARFG